MCGILFAAPAWFLDIIISTCYSSGHAKYQRSTVKELMNLIKLSMNT